MFLLETWGFSTIYFKGEREAVPKLKIEMFKEKY